MSAMKHFIWLALSSGVLAQFSPLKCGGSTSDVSNCYFEGEHCNFFRRFDSPLKAVPFFSYNGDPTSADFVIESGNPFIRNNILHLPLTQNPQGGRQSTATIMSTTRFLNYGSFEARMASVQQSSVVSTFISISNLEDEIDFEFTPKDPSHYNEAQTNWFYRGEKTFGVNFAPFQTANDTSNNFHTYRVDFLPESITWSIDGQAVRTLVRSQMSNPSRFPATPPRIQFGVWQALDNQWAGLDSNINWNQVNARGGLNVRFEYIRIQGRSCMDGPPPPSPRPSSTVSNTATNTATQRPPSSSTTKTVSPGGNGSSDPTQSPGQGSGNPTQVATLSTTCTSTLSANPTQATGYDSSNASSQNVNSHATNPSASSWVHVLVSAAVVVYSLF